VGSGTSPKVDCGGPDLAGLVRPLPFVLFCASACFAFLALFVRFANHPHAVTRSAAENAYGIYLVHYAFVTGCQYLLLSVRLPAFAKAALVLAAAYLLSFGAAALLRRIPQVARVV